MHIDLMPPSSARAQQQYERERDQMRERFSGKFSDLKICITTSEADEMRSCVGQRPTGYPINAAELHHLTLSRMGQGSMRQMMEIKARFFDMLVHHIQDIDSDSTADNNDFFECPDCGTTHWRK